MNRAISSVARAPLWPFGTRSWARHEGDSDTGAAWCDATPGWSLQRRCALAPRQLLSALVVLAVVPALVALVFWLQGVRLIAAFAGLEWLALAAAFYWHALHAADGERLQLQGAQLLVERRSGLQATCEAWPLATLRVQASDRGIELRAGHRRSVIGRVADVRQRQQVLAALRRLDTPAGAAGTPQAE